jgi:hypothetical protein
MDGNDTEFSCDMFNVLVCYVANASPEVPRLCTILDKVARQMVKNRPLKEMKLHVDSILPDLQRYLESRDDLIPLSTFVPVDPSMHQVDPLELFSHTTVNEANRIRCLQLDDIEMDKGKRELASKRRRLSL